ncbi:putative enoyl-CoA hydratase echA8 [Achromobacter mucicolens]|uniref:enoyl-CoA hydratase/isomerase family protein n=1 Tax=Achromobacter mucicolens TaxID=1389922 RepID=UPI0009CC32CC|nr:enoyl-CoA hydratase/isomerase family protein [Achromobacter mucicolens]OXC89989.1 enoyl-CoA hydratase [Achromobacter sp. KAs 3-5]CAB3633390.1 putative enoyl-CoA hydratase echA8 [Achromobacter mucicolens]
MNPVRYEVRDGIAEIQLCHAPVNALDVGVLDALIGALEKANADAGVRAVLLASSLPGRFCAGLDMKQLLQSPPARVRELLTRLYIKLYDAQFNLTKPSISVVSGAVRGGGMTVAISSDMIVAADSATFGYPEIDVGVLPAIHYVHLPAVVGKHRAFDLLFTGRTFSAGEAQAMGLVSRVAAEAELLDEARTLARSLAQKPPEVLAMGRRAFVYSNDNEYRRRVATAVEVFCNAAATPEAREGLSAFVQKRAPDWASVGESR